MLEIILGIALMVLAVAIVILVLMQQGKDKKLSGSVAGGADTYYGKGKGNRRDKLLFRLTLVGAILFGVLVVAMYVVVFKLNG